MAYGASILIGKLVDESRWLALRLVCLPSASHLLPADLLKRHDIGALRRRYSKTEGGAYLSNGCAHCDALQGRFFEHNYGYNLEVTLEVAASLERAWAPQLEDSRDIYRWWFDERS